MFEEEIDNRAVLERASQHIIIDRLVRGALVRVTSVKHLDRKHKLARVNIALYSRAAFKYQYCNVIV